MSDGFGAYAALIIFAIFACSMIIISGQNQPSIAPATTPITVPSSPGNYEIVTTCTVTETLNSTTIIRADPTATKTIEITRTTSTFNNITEAPVGNASVFRIFGMNFIYPQNSNFNGTLISENNSTAVIQQTRSECNP